MTNADARQVEALGRTEYGLEAAVGFLVLLQNPRGWAGLRHDKRRRGFDLERGWRFDPLDGDSLEQAVPKRLLPGDPIRARLGDGGNKAGLEVFEGQRQVCDALSDAPPPAGRLRVELLVSESLSQLMRSSDRLLDLAAKLLNNAHGRRISEQRHRGTHSRVS